MNKNPSLAEGVSHFSKELTSIKIFRQLFDLSDKAYAWTSREKKWALRLQCVPAIGHEPIKLLKALSSSFGQYHL